MSSRLILRRLPFQLRQYNKDFVTIHTPSRSIAQFHYRPQIHPTQNLLQEVTIQSSLGATTIVATVACVLLGSSALLYYNTQLGKIEDLKAPSDLEILSDTCTTVELDNRTVVMAIQPGRPGNLTVEQEVKLQEFWKASLKVFGVPVEDGPEPSEIAEGADEKTEDGAVDGAAGDKKKRKGFFGRKKEGKSEEKDKKKEKEKDKSASTEDKYGQLKDFQDALAQTSPEELRTAFWSMLKHDNPDALLLRFLRARKWDVEKALVMMIATMQWRLKEVHVEDDIVRKGEEAALQDSSSSDAAVKKEGEDFLAQLRLGKSFLHGTDKEGRPMCVVRARLHRQGEQSEASLERYTVHVLETARLLLSPPVDTAVWMPRATVISVY